MARSENSQAYINRVNEVPQTCDRKKNSSLFFQMEAKISMCKDRKKMCNPFLTKQKTKDTNKHYLSQVYRQGSIFFKHHVNINK